jgi:predicted DCC family thiol-disulfide oxidoreductase YuxK
LTDTPESTPVIDQAPILVFDGDCGFCTTSALWVARHWPEGPRMVVPKIVAWQALGDEGLHDLGLSREQANASAWWVDGRGQFGADKAIAKALLACRAPWSWLGGALVVPPGTWLGRFLYPVIARHRHRLPGSTAACRVDEVKPRSPGTGDSGTG